MVNMYNTPVGSVAAGFGGLATAPFTGVNAIWIGLALFTLVSAGVAVKRLLPKREA